MRRATLVRACALATALVVTTVLWLLPKSRFEQGWQTALWQALSQISPLWASDRIRYRPAHFRAQPRRREALGWSRRVVTHARILG
jgi:hypothetical protein